MGLTLIDKNADFSAISVGSLFAKTSVVSGLLALFETRRDAALAVANRGSGTDGTIFGAPTFAVANMTADETRGVNFGIAPTGNHTVAAVFKIRPGAITESYPVGAFGGTGYEFFNMGNSTVYFLSSVGPNAALPKPATATFEMYVATAENNVAAKLRHPRTASLATVATANAFTYEAPANYSASLIGASSADDDFALFAYWDRVLSLAEITTFYTEIKAHLAKLGVVI